MSNKAFILILVLLLTSCNDVVQKRTIRLGHGLDTNHSVHKAMVKMGEELYRLSSGTMDLKIYPNQQLGSERECLELLQIGSLDVTKVSTGVLENFSPNMKVFGLPYLFRDKAHAFDVLDGDIGKKLLDETLAFRIKGLAYYDAGSRSFYTKNKPINVPADLEGLKVRVMESVTAMKMVESMGGSPTPISWGELYTSLQQEVVDGAENNPPSFYLSKQFEVCKYYTLDEHTTLPDVLVCGSYFWDTLNTEQKKWMQEAVDISVRYQRTLWAASEAHSLEQLEKAGVQIIYPDKSAFAQLVKPVYELYSSSESLNNLIVEIKKK
ncbi:MULTISPECIES: TRAP transporter substrate-binding protein [Flavobacteriaceae]|uniref:TRAP transporter substrate-binding protein n=2 Tax=Flavobacteriales TaxID=200644 RepID=UPI004048CF77